jgi:hypothetical protein
MGMLGRSVVLFAGGDDVVLQLAVTRVLYREGKETSFR